MAVKKFYLEYFVNPALGMLKRQLEFLPAYTDFIPFTADPQMIK